MAKKNDDFFKEKKSWSEVKDALLGNYLKPYLQKILHTRKSIVYVDCFAGKGVFEDGQPGSPLIALQTMQDCLNHTAMSAWNIESYFIDLNYANDLKVNLREYPGIKVISGKYEDEICGILEKKRGCNMFLYVDPYGIKALDCSLFDSFATHGFNSIELLINMNSFGFIREGCRVLGVNLDNDDIFEDLVEYDSTRLSADKKSKSALDKIAGGDYWTHIIENKRRNKITAYDAEAQFADEYCKRLRQSYSYVLNMPLRIRPGQVPKYRTSYLRKVFRRYNIVPSKSKRLEYDFVTRVAEELLNASGFQRELAAYIRGMEQAILVMKQKIRYEIEAIENLRKATGL